MARSGSLMIGVVALLVVAVLLATRHMWSTNSAENPPLILQQQREWQSRWLKPVSASAQHSASVAAISHSPPSPPAIGQATEARRAVATALTQLIPPKGDGRRGGFDDQRNVKRESDTIRRMLQQDGLAEWRPDPSLLPPQQPAGASMSELLRAVPVGGTAWLAFGNAGATEMLMNWIFWTLKLGLGDRLVIAAYDNALLGYLRERRLPAYNCASRASPRHGPS